MIVSSSARNLIVCCDGTNNQFGSENTNVVRLVQAASRDDALQRVYYDPGVGTFPLPGFVSRVGQRISEIAGLAFGAGLLAKVGDAYRFLMDTHQLGDRVLLFGFSRGAYTVRMLAGLLHMYGLLPRGSENLLPYVLRQFAEARHRLEGDQEAFWDLADEFRRTFARDAGTGTARRFPIHFMGVWDTVSSVGWVWDPQTFPFTTANPSVRTVRHAISLAERRAFFRQNRFSPSVKGQDLVELWFPGVHADVGGGYPESEGGLWREPFLWMLDEAKSSGLHVDQAAIQRVLGRSPAPARPWLEPQHESLTRVWRPAEFFPKLRWDETRGRKWPSLGLGRPRHLAADVRLHDSVRRRVRDAYPRYLPRNPGFELALAAARQSTLKEATMHRGDFGNWGNGLADGAFWRAVIMLGLAGAQQPDPPGPRADLQAMLQTVIDALPGGKPLAELDGPRWYVPQDWITAARSGIIVAADQLDALFIQLLHTQRLPPRIESLALYDNDVELVAAIYQSAGVCLYHPVRERAPGDDWHWPLRFTFPNDEEHDALYGSFIELAGSSQTIRRLTRASRFGEEPVAEFAVAIGSIAQALERIESAAVPLRAHVILVVDSTPVEASEETVAMIERLQSLALAKAVIVAQIARVAFRGWVHEFVRQLSHNDPIDRALCAQLPVPVMFIDPSLFEIARIERFAGRVRAALDAVHEQPVELDHEAAQPIGLAAGVFAAGAVSAALADTLRSSSAFDEEIRGATWTTRVLAAAGRSRVIAEGRHARNERERAEPIRRAQLDVMRDGERVRNFRAGYQHQIEFFIAADGGMLQGQPFPEELLPGDEAGHLLTVTLNAPGFLEQPQLRTVFLPRSGPSGRCGFAVTTGTDRARFEARISIAYLNRTLQTLRLSGSVVGATGAGDDPIELDPEMATQRGWVGLDFQQPYDATLTINRLGGESGGTLQIGYRVLGFSIEGLSDATTLIESRIDASRWDAPAMQGMAGAESRTLVQFLAFHGSSLWSTVTRYAQRNAAGESLMKHLLEAEVIQVLSANLGARLPIEFFYSGTRPSAQSKICPFHELRVTAQECRNCPHHDRDHFCPAGLWALNRGVEWHQFDESNARLAEFAPREFAIQSEAEAERRDRLRPITDVVLAASPNATNVDPDCVKRLVERIEKLGVTVHQTADWAEVDAKLAAVQPAVLLVLPHVARGTLAQPCLEVGGTLRDESDIEVMDLGTPAGASGPVVLLIGCSTDNVALPYASFPVRFSARASVVVSTISHVLGRHAAPLAGEIVAAMVAGQRAGDTRFSSAIRAARRDALRDDLPPVALALKCYGDARWWL